MRILSIETSCDETGIAIIKGKGTKIPSFEVIAHQVASQIKLHQPYGGVYPMLAKREHLKNLPLVLKKVLKEAKISKDKPELDAIAVTVGAGLSPCLWTGINFAKELSQKWNLPLIPVNHVEGHLLTPLLEQQLQFPAVALLVSGGHTQLIYAKKIGDYQLLGETRDDAAGECFDKTARILGLEYPGGPVISKLAEKNQKNTFNIDLPRPMINTKDYDFSFSGLKTAVLYDAKKQTKKERESASYIRAMAKEIQQAIIDVLVKKTIRAVHQYEPKTVIIGGGVAANKELRNQLEEKLSTEYPKATLAVASPHLCTDNGAMIGVAGYTQWLAKNIATDLEMVEAQPNLKIE